MTKSFRATLDTHAHTREELLTQNLLDLIIEARSLQLSGDFYERLNAEASKFIWNIDKLYFFEEHRESLAPYMDGEVAISSGHWQAALEDFEESMRKALDIVDLISQVAPNKVANVETFFCDLLICARPTNFDKNPLCDSDVFERSAKIIFGHLGPSEPSQEMNVMLGLD